MILTAKTVKKQEANTGMHASRIFSPIYYGLGTFLIIHSFDGNHFPSMVSHNSLFNYHFCHRKRDKIGNKSVHMFSENLLGL